MSSESFQCKLTDYILSGHAFLHCPTTEKTRFQSELATIAEALPDDGRQIFTWSHATGWLDSTNDLPRSNLPKQRIACARPVPVLRALRRLAGL